MNIIYNTPAGEKNIDIELPESYFLRFDAEAALNIPEHETVHILDSALTLDFWNDQEIDLDFYQIYEINSADNPLFSFIICVKHGLVEVSAELEAAYNECITYNLPAAKLNSDNESIHLYIREVLTVWPNPEDAEDYVPPIEAEE